MELYLHTSCINLSCLFVTLLKNVFSTIWIWMNMGRLIGEDMEGKDNNLFSNIRPLKTKGICFI
jgi:hypothetical protein